MNNNTEKALINHICDNWNATTNHIDAAYRERKISLANVISNTFSGWLDGVYETALRAGMKEAAELASTAGYLLIFRQSIEPHEQADQTQQSANTGAVRVAATTE